MTVLGSGAFGRCLSHEGGAFMNGISALIKEAPEISLILSPCRAQGEVMAVNQEVGPQQAVTPLVP